FASYVSTELFKDDLVRTGGFFSPTWGVVIEQTEREAFQPARELMKKFMYVVTVFMLFSIALGVVFSHGITRQLKMLHKVALSIAGGDLSQELHIDSGDEIGELAKSFDKMRKNLKKKMSDLKILYEISQTISAVLDYKELLSEIMDISINVLEAEKGSIMLFDDETEMLKIEASYGLPEDIIRDTLINPNRGIVGWVIRTGKPLLIYDTMKEAGFEKMKGRKAESGTLMSAPLKVKDKLIGVINISKSIPNTYNDSDRDLFEAIALQAAIAIDKAILYRLAITDGLTKLYIHRYFQQRLDEELQRAKRYSKPLSFLMMDIDHFKIFNDTYGHQVGDRVLKIVARLVEKSVRDVDIPARYGGEEFSVILPELTTEEARVPAERIRKNIETYDFYVEDKIVPITVSLGVSTYPYHAEEKVDLIEAADNAMYYSKETGRNKYSVFSPELLKKLKELKSK
ncbi:MAG: diguanylate cyclase, partial [Candidatus Muirbacterium halophilum]|nr:diguanylate cyclase [Candidatus Muirbacterium halophilum]